MFTCRGKTTSLAKLTKQGHPWASSGVRDLRSLATVEGVFAQWQVGKKPRKTVLLKVAISLLWEMVGTFLTSKDPEPWGEREVIATDLVRDQSDQPAHSALETKKERIPQEGGSPPVKSKVSAIMKSKMQQAQHGQPGLQEWEVTP